MAGLFSNEGDVMSNIMQRRQQANQALGSPYGKYGGIVQAGGMFADIGADAAAGGGYGAADPRMQQQKELKQIAAVVAQQFPGKTDSPDFYKALALAVQDKYPQKAQEAMQMAAKREQEIAQGKLTSLKTKQAEAEIAASKAATEKASKDTETRKQAVNSLFPDSDQALKEAVANDEALFKSVVTEKYKNKERQTEIRNVGGNVVLLDKQTGDTLRVIGPAPDTRPVVNISGEQESAFVKERAKTQAQTLASVEKEGKNAETALRTLEGMQKTNLNGIYSGPQAQIVMNTNNFLESIGLLSKEDTKKLTNSTSYDKFAKDLVMQDLDGKLGAQVSDADRKYVEARIPQLTTNPQARTELIAKLMEINKRKIAYRDQMVEYANKENNLNGFKFDDPFKAKKDRKTLSAFQK